jgi:hypothetical protein
MSLYPIHSPTALAIKTADRDLRRRVVTPDSGGG